MNAPNYSFKLPDTGFKKVPAGIQQVIVYQIAYLGYQDGGKFRPRRQIALNYLTEDGPTIVQKCNPSSHPRSAFPALVSALLGRDLNQEELKVLDLAELLGKAATIQVKHNVGAGGKVSAKVVNVLPAIGDAWKRIVPRDYAFYVPGMPDEVSAAEFAKLPTFIQNDIKGQLSEDQYRLKLAAFKAANPESKTDDPDLVE